MGGPTFIPWGCLSKSNETLLRNHQNLMQSECHQALTDFSAPCGTELASRNAGLDQNVQLYTMCSQNIRLPPQTMQNATQQGDHHRQQCQLQKIFQTHQAIAHQHMPSKCQKQQPHVDRELAAHQGQIQDATDQAAMAWADYLRASQSSPLREKQLQKHQTIHQNPQKIQ